MKSDYVYRDYFFYFTEDFLRGSKNCIVVFRTIMSCINIIFMIPLETQNKAPPRKFSAIIKSLKSSQGLQSVLRRM